MSGLEECGEEETPCLVTNYTFDRKDYLIKMYVKTNILKLTIIDNVTSEKWVCSYNSMYIEELTRRTGNYKKFNVFISMLNSGILKRSGSVRIELMSHHDLEALTDRYKSNQDYNSATNRRDEDTRKYLILVYTVEFDRIHYPLPLEYCGMPNPRVLQKKIQYLEKEKSRLEEELSNAVCSKCSRELPELQQKLIRMADEKKSLEHEVKCLAAELGNRYTSSRFPPTVRGTVSDDRKYLEDRIKLLEKENLKLVKTVEQMEKRQQQKSAPNQRFLYKPSRRCRQCSDLSADINKCPIRSKSRTESLRKFPRSKGSPVRSKQSDVSPRSSASSGKYGSLKGKQGRGKMKVKRSDLDISSSSGVEEEFGRDGKGGLRRRLASVERRTAASSPSRDKPTQTSQPPVSHLQPQSQFVPIDQQLRKQIYDLVRLVETWSNDFSTLAPDHCHT